LVVSLKTGVLTSHKYPKGERDGVTYMHYDSNTGLLTSKKIPESAIIFYHYNEDTYVKLPHNVDEAIIRVASIWKNGTIEVKDRGVAITVLGNMTNFDRAMRKLYEDLAV